jgi:predicted aspartyl protease
MTVAVKDSHSSPVAIRRDPLDFPRASARINGHRVDAVLDTGASNSVASESTARRLHLRMLKFGGGGVLAGGVNRVRSQFAVADTLLFAGREFHDVPFIVLPDAATIIPMEDGKVDRSEPIIGLSVLRKLGRIEILERDGHETLQIGGNPTTSMPANLFLPEAAAIALVRVEPQGAELRMSLDTGANRTALAPAAITAFPALASGAIQDRTGVANSGGTLSDDAGTIIPQLTLRIGEATTPISRVSVLPGPANCEGTLGQDVFRSGGGYVIDFDRMTLEILPAAGAR